MSVPSRFPRMLPLSAPPKLFVLRNARQQRELEPTPSLVPPTWAGDDADATDDEILFPSYDRVARQAHRVAAAVGPHAGDAVPSPTASSWEGAGVRLEWASPANAGCTNGAPGDGAASEDGIDAASGAVEPGHRLAQPQLSDLATDGGSFSTLDILPSETMPLERADMEEVDFTAAGEFRTTLVLNCLPLCYGRDAVLSMLEAHGFKGKADFVYVPCHFGTQKPFGYAFVNFVSVRTAQQAAAFYSGFSGWRVESDRVCHVQWAAVNGLRDNIEHFRSSAVMHPSVSDLVKPILLDGRGKRRPFPRPLHRIRVPRTRRDP